MAGKVVVITGASRGLGAGLATEMSSRGMLLGVCARHKPALEDMEDAVQAKVDVRDREAIDRFLETVTERLGTIDMWINNAGVLDPMGPLRDAEPEALERHIEINVLGVMYGSQAFCRHRREVGPGGVLINISSGAGRKGYFGWGAYCAGKAAVDRLTECLALEEKAAGTRCHAVAPGIIDTHMQEQIRAATPEQFPDAERFVRIKREEKFSSPKWVASRLLELAFDPAHKTDDVLIGLPLEHQL